MNTAMKTMVDPKLLNKSFEENPFSSKYSFKPVSSFSISFELKR
jgi:hypothetical protein